LEALLEHSGMLRVVRSGYDKDNWYAVAERLP